MENPSADKPFKEGKVTEFREQQKNPLRISVYIDGKFSFGAYRDTLLQTGLRKGDFIDHVLYEKLLIEDQVPIAKSKALHFIGYRPRSTYEVRKKLKEEKFAEDIIETVLEKLSDLGFLDDARFATLFCESRLRKYGPERVKMDLRRLGISNDHIQNALIESTTEDDLKAQLAELVQKLMPKYAKEEDVRKRQQKLYAALIRRGYAYEMVGEALRNIK